MSRQYVVTLLRIEYEGTSLAVKKKKKSKLLRRTLLSCLPLRRVSAQEDAPQQGSVGILERYQVPYTLAVSGVDKLTLELDFTAVDTAGGGYHTIPSALKTLAPSTNVMERLAQ